MASLPRSWARALAGVFANLCAGWYGLVFIVPNFWPLTNPGQWIVLLLDLFFGTVCLLTTVKLAGESEKYDH